MNLLSTRHHQPWFCCSLLLTDRTLVRLNQKKRCQNIKWTVSENINRTSVLNPSQASLFPDPNHRTQSLNGKKKNTNPWSETDILISEAVRPPQSSPAPPFVSGSPKEVRSFSERRDFALRVRQAGGVFYHIWCVGACQGKAEGLTEYHMWASSLTQIQKPGEKKKNHEKQLSH